jgi:S1-C subfamily serine protease
MGAKMFGMISGSVRGAEAKNFLENGLMVQIDAPIYPGHSGGAVVDGDGRIIGIMDSHVEDAHDVGLALPVRDIRAFLNASGIEF